jgi:hypothetical protein
MLATVVGCAATVVGCAAGQRAASNERFLACGGGCVAAQGSASNEPFLACVGGRVAVRLASRRVAAFAQPTAGAAKRYGRVSSTRSAG